MFFFFNASHTKLFIALSNLSGLNTLTNKSLWNAERLNFTELGNSFSQLSDVPQEFHSLELKLQV